MVFSMYKAPGPVTLLAMALVMGTRAAPIQEEQPGSFSIAAMGDFLGAIRDSNDPLVQGVFDLVRESDFGFFNMEGNIFDLATYDGFPGSENGQENDYGNVGGGARYDAVNAARLAAAGFTLASHANNHGFDWLETGMFATHENFDKANITLAGSGDSLQTAREAKYRTSDSGVTVALVAASGSHFPAQVAGPGNAAWNVKPRPGVSTLRAPHATLVTREVFESLKEVARAQGMPFTDTEIILYSGQSPFFASKWRLSPTNEPGLVYEMYASDYNGILGAIRDARQKTDHVFFSLHGHESISGHFDGYIPLAEEATIPADYIQNMSRSAIDAGASAVFVHGPHVLRGIELYEGRPIFYSLTSMTYSLGLNIRGFSLPIEWDDSILARLHFEDGAFDHAELYTIVHSQLKNDTSDPESALPKMAPPAEAKRILTYLGKSSEAFNTTIEICGNKGYLRAGSQL